MDFTAAKKDFALALAKAQGIPEQKNLSSVMANILLESVGSEAVRLTAQSYEVTLVTVFPAHVAQEGRMALTARSLTERARMLPEAPVNLKLMDNLWASLSVGQRSSTIPGTLPDNMPEVSEPNPNVELTVPRDLLLEMVDRVGFAMSMDEGRPNLNGINISVVPDGTSVQVDAVATDGHRLSWLSRTLEGVEGAERVSAILHRKGVADLKRFLEGYEGMVRVGFLRNAVVFRIDSGYLMVRQIELEYPEFRKVVPSGFRFSVDIDRDELISAVRWTLPSIAQEKTPLVRLKFEPGSVTVMARDPERGDASTSVDVAYEGESFEIAYNNRYLLDALSAMGDKSVRLSIKGEASASLLTSTGDDGLKQVIMPVRI
ncbi:DNA polymerase III subunit beta [Myxococcota bacterium]|nr:DNA polymerase III subunit beta [Myxococcota bacterium]HOD06570.1 DNA polymerase III subunit beta [Myxococcota bacterium]